MPKRFLNVVYDNLPTRINVTDMERLSEVQEEIERAYYPRVNALKIQLWNKNETPHTLLEDLDDIKNLPEQYFWKLKQPGALFLSIQPLVFTGGMYNILYRISVVDLFSNR